MNLQSNALKFTKEGGSIQILTEYVRAVSSKSESKKHSKSKTLRRFKESFSSINRSRSEYESNISEISRFEKEHKIEQILQPHVGRDKIVISVIDSGVGIK